MPRPTRCLYAYRTVERPACQLNATLAYGTTGLCTSCNEQRSTLGKGQRTPCQQPGRALTIGAFTGCW